MPRKDTQKGAEYVRRWRKQNPGKLSLYAKNAAEYKKKWYLEHKDALKKSSLERYKRNRETIRRQMRENYLKTQYGLTTEKYTKMLSDQGGACFVCRLPAERHKGRLHVDHCHKTGLVRRLLCFHCNSALGHMKESAEVARAMVQYVEEECAPLLGHSVDG